MDFGAENQIFGVFVFDGDCGICTKSVQFLKYVVAAKLDFVPYQVASLDEMGITKEDCQRAAQLIAFSGERFQGFDAFRLALGSSPSKELHLVAKIMKMRMVRTVGSWVYDKVASGRHNGALGGRGCRLPQTHGSAKTENRTEAWERIKADKSTKFAFELNSLIGEPEEIMTEWSYFRHQLNLVSVSFLIAAVLLSMRILFDDIIGYPFGWQMFS